MSPNHERGVACQQRVLCRKTIRNIQVIGISSIGKCMKIVQEFEEMRSEPETLGQS